MSKEKEENLVVVGKILGSFGVKGEIKVQPYTDSLEELFEFKTLYIKTKGTTVEFLVEAARRGGGHRALLKLKGIETKEQAQLLRGNFLFVPRESLRKIEEKDTFYYCDLIGLEVIRGKRHFGYVKRVEKMGPHEYLIVESEKYGEVIVPFIKVFVKKVDLQEKKIYVKFLKGFLQK